MTTPPAKEAELRGITVCAIAPSRENEGAYLEERRSQFVGLILSSSFRLAIPVVILAHRSIIF